MRKLTLGLVFATLLTFGAFGQVVGPRLGRYLGQENLVLIWLNVLELSPAQMKAMLELVEELLPLREEIVAMPEKLHEELLAFQGSAKELRELLATYQKDLREKLQSLEDQFVSGLKKILTVAQWERMKQGLPLEEPRIPERMRERMGTTPAPRAAPVPPARPKAMGEPRLDLLRGMIIVRLLPTLQEVLSAKLAALGK
ncbi:MAG: hypothetical protein ACK42E_01725 [Candidatus Bipolaricaulaceae bacterium]